MAADNVVTCQAGRERLEQKERIWGMMKERRRLAETGRQKEEENEPGRQVGKVSATGRQKED